MIMMTCKDEDEDDDVGSCGTDGPDGSGKILIKVRDDMT